MGMLRRLLGQRGSTREEQFKAAGDRVEEAARDFHQARPMLRLVLLPAPAVPPGDVHRSAFAEGAAELLALDAGQSVRYVSEALAASWNAAPEEIWQVAEEVTLRQPTKRLGRQEMGSRVIGLQISDGTPAITPFLRHLEEVAPEVVGPLGTLVGVPDGSGCFLLGLDRYEELRSDIVDLAALTFEVAQMPGTRLFPIPFWRKPDGTMRPVRLNIGDDGRLLTSYDAAFAGVLAALDPVTDMAVPEWAKELETRQYAELAGLIAAAAAIRPEDIAEAPGLQPGSLVRAWRGGGDLGSRFIAVSKAVGAQSFGAAYRRPIANPVLDPDNEARLVAALAEPRLSSDEAKRFAELTRRAVEAMDDPGAVLGQLGYRQLVDIAAECRVAPEAQWPDIISRQLLEIGAQTEQLTRMEESGYEDVRPHLWASLWPRPFSGPLGSEIRVLEDQPLPGLYRRVAFYASGARSRPVRSDHLERWGVDEQVVWDDAADNMVAASKEVQPWPADDAPVRIIRNSERDSEMLGLLLHRLPDACPQGHAVAVPFRGSALYLRLDAPDALRAIPIFTHLAGKAFREASQFDDHLLPKLLWLRADGSTVELCDLFRPPERPDELPPAFLAAVAAAGIRSREQSIT